MSDANWFAQKIANNQAPAPQVVQPRQMNMPAMPPSQQPMQPMPSFQNPQAERAQSAKQTATCPECGSANYMAVSNAAPRCYDCGYPISQSGSRYGNLAGAHVEGSARNATGNDTQSNWNPQGIIGRIDG